MTADPRVEAVAEALDTHYQRLTMDSVYQCACGVRGYRSEWPQHLAAVAVAQVNLLAPAEPTEAVVEAAVARAVLAERDRIARTIGQEWQRRSDEWGYRVDSHQEGVLDGLAEAEEIARGQS